MTVMWRLLLLLLVLIEGVRVYYHLLPLTLMILLFTIEVILYLVMWILMVISRVLLHLMRFIERTGKTLHSALEFISNALKKGMLW